MAVEQPAAPAPEAIRVSGVEKAFGAVPVLRGIDLDVDSGSVLALLGPSGCGKTTLLRIIAGLEVPGAGSVEVGDRVLTGPGVLVPPERRRVGLVFQDWALFPHLTVARNVAYGLPRDERRGRSQRVQEALDMVGLGHLGDRLPGTLSGGQQQRVALARALAPRPSVLLLDEPFSNLDAALRVQVRTDLHRLLAELGITTLFVTHDQEEAFVLGDAVAIMSEGDIVQSGTPAQVYEEPVSPWVASFVGDANLLAGTAAGGKVARTAIGDVALRTEADGPVEVLVRPEDVRVALGEGGAVRTIEYHGHDTVYDVVLDGDGNGEAHGPMVRVRVAGRPALARGERVEVAYRGSPAAAWPAAAAPAGAADSPEPPAA